MPSLPFVDRYRGYIGACFPEFMLRTFEFVGGSSCRVFLANRDTYFRFAHSEKGARTIRKERKFFSHIRNRVPLAVPFYSMYSEGCGEFNHPVAGYKAVPGVPVAGIKLSSEAPIQLGRFLKALHALPCPPGWEAEGSRIPADRAQQLLGQIEAHRTALTVEQLSWTRGLFKDFLASTASRTPHPVVLVHNDIDHYNILCDESTGQLTGIIDAEESTVGDPARDFTPMRAEFGRAFVESALHAYGGPPDPYFVARVAFWSAALPFHEMLYGIEKNAGVHVENALARLDRAVRGEDITGGWPLVKTAASAGWGEASD